MRLLAILSLLLLGACNVVMTEQPLFTAADEAGAPAMKPGIWRMEDPDCAVDETKPLEQWPDCAGGAIFEPGMISGHDKKDGKDVWVHDPFLLVAGAPRVAQIKMVEELVGPGAEHRAPYAYAGVLPMASDAAGAITAITYWPVQCGPPAPPGAKTRQGKPAYGTLHPLPGMVMKPGDAMCTTTSPAVVRNAAKLSRAWEDKPMHAHWVRAGEH